jgi:hypothetical protein
LSLNTALPSPSQPSSSPLSGLLFAQERTHRIRLPDDCLICSVDRRPSSMTDLCRNLPIRIGTT